MAQVRFVKTETRLNEWIRRLSKSREEKLRAIDLYSGDHWHVLKTLAEAPTKPQEFKLWVASAGWGLIGSGDMIGSYGATFSHSDPDSVIHPRVDARESRLWWNALVQSPIRGKHSPSSFSSLAKNYPKLPLIVALSPKYLAAVRNDLLLARSLLKSPELLIVVSSGTKKLADLTSNLIPCDSRLQPTLGGALISLNARVVRFILENYEINQIRATRVIEDFHRLLLKGEKRILPERKTMTDEQVSRFIFKQTSVDPSKHSHSSLLRLFRDSGNACEQSRFREIYRRVVEQKKFNEEKR